jgi:3-oxoacyl-[acyl-carrier protein] reductase
MVLEEKLLGKVALVTGGSRGLGRAYVLRLAQLGADVVINDIDLEAYKEYGEDLESYKEYGPQVTATSVMDEVRNLGRRSLGIEADMTRKEEVKDVFKNILDEFGKIDILVNNAGGALRRPGGPQWPEPVPMGASEVSEEDFFYQFNINYLSAVLCCQAAAIPMKKQGSGKIVNIASQAGLYTDVGGGGMPYKVAKAAVVHYTRILAAELGKYNINVNCISPAWILSSRAVAWGRNKPDMRKRLEKRIALGRLGLPEDCAKVIEFLVTDLSDYVTGQNIPVCGGVILF